MVCSLSDLVCRSGSTSGKTVGRLHPLWFSPQLIPLHSLKENWISSPWLSILSCFARILFTYDTKFKKVGLFGTVRKKMSATFHSRWSDYSVRMQAIGVTCTITPDAERKATTTTSEQKKFRIGIPNNSHFHIIRRRFITWFYVLQPWFTSASNCQLTKLSVVYKNAKHSTTPTWPRLSPGILRSP